MEISEIKQRLTMAQVLVKVAIVVKCISLYFEYTTNI
jgi:hypothetical protein